MRVMSELTNTGKRWLYNNEECRTIWYQRWNSVLTHVYKINIHKHIYTLWFSIIRFISLFFTIPLFLNSWLYISFSIEMISLLVFSLLFSQVTCECFKVCCKKSGDFAECTGIDVCPIRASTVKVQCWIRSLISTGVIQQVLIDGDCSLTSVELLCQNPNVLEIKMIDQGNSKTCHGK